MAKKRLKIKDKQGNVVDYDISAASVTIDVEGKSLDVKLSELVDAIARSVKSVTFNGNSPTMDSNGNVNLGQQVQPDWKEGNINWPSYIKNKPSFSRVATTGSYNDLTDKPTIPEGVATDSQMSDSSDAPVKNRVIKAYVDNLISGLINGAPQALDTLNELSAALGNDANFAATITNQLANKANSADVYTKSQTYDKDEVDTALGGKLGVNDVSAQTPTTPDGTFSIQVGEKTYTINLNHTHSQYASKKTVTSTNESAVTLSADVIYDLGTVAGNKTISLPSMVDAAAEYEFRFDYTSGDITLPSGVLVANDATFSPTAGMTYQVVICGGILYFSETTIPS